VIERDAPGQQHRREDGRCGDRSEFRRLERRLPEPERDVDRDTQHTDEHEGFHRRQRRHGPVSQRQPLDEIAARQEGRREREDRERHPV